MVKRQLFLTFKFLPCLLGIVCCCCCVFQASAVLAAAAAVETTQVAGEATSATPSTEKCQLVVNKLEAYTRGLLPESGLTIQELREAHEEYLGWSEFVREHLKQKQPLFHLLADFLLVPMEKFDELIGYGDHGDEPKTDENDDDSLHVKFIRRLEENYKKFKPAYLGEMLGPNYSRASKMDTLIHSFMGLQLRKTLTKKMLDAAILEYHAFKERLEDIGVHEDIYSNLFEFKLSMNLINRDDVKILVKSIFPLADRVKDDSDMQVLQEIFVKEMRKKNYIVEDGRLNKLVYRTAAPSQNSQCRTANCVPKVPVSTRTQQAAN